MADPPKIEWTDSTTAKIFRLTFKDKGRLIDTAQHPLLLQWAARDKTAHDKE
jgi:hypothetical protein